VLSKALAYDASPTAGALLGSGDVEFGVLVYSKAASLLAMLAVYGMASKSNEDQLEQGPIPELLHHTPPGKVQVRDPARPARCPVAGQVLTA